MDKNHAIVEQDGHVLIITLNRPEKRNALSPGMLVTVYEAWRQLDDDDNLRCAILTGAGGTFCSASKALIFSGRLSLSIRTAFADSISNLLIYL